MLYRTCKLFTTYVLYHNLNKKNIYVIYVIILYIVSLFGSFLDHLDSDCCVNKCFVFNAVHDFITISL